MPTDPSRTSMNLTVVFRDALQRLTFAQSAELGRRLQLSDVGLAAIRVAEQHVDELAALLSSDQEGTPQ